MRGLVLAGGRGSRLAPYTNDRPKTLIEVAGRTLLDRQVAALRRAGASEVAVIAGWRAEAVQRTGVPTLVAPWGPSQMVESLRAAHEWFEIDDVIVVYGDIVVTSADVRRMAMCDRALAIAYDPRWFDMWKVRFRDPLDDAERFRRQPDGRLIEAGGHAESLADVDGQYLGLAKISPLGWSEALRVIADAQDGGDPVRDVTDLLTRIVRAGRLDVWTIPIEGPWWEFDHPSDLMRGVEVVHRIDADEADAN